MQALQQLFLVAGTAALEERMSSSSCSVTFPLIAVKRSVSNYETSTTKGELPRLCSPCLPHTHSLAFISIKFLWYRHLCVLFISASAIPPPPISPPCDFPTSWFALSYSLCIIHFTVYAVAERLRRAYPAPLGRDGVGSIPANPPTHEACLLSAVGDLK